jgi:hypothetical protein
MTEHREPATDDDSFVRARQRLLDEARALLRNQCSMADFFRTFMGLTRELAGDGGLDGFDLDVFQRLEAWESAVGVDRADEEAALRTRLAQFVPPDGYQDPILAWVVEYSDPREPGATFQAGAFTSEAEARRLLERTEADAAGCDVRLNMIPIHQTLEDWEWDR